MRQFIMARALSEMPIPEEGCEDHTEKGHESSIDFSRKASPAEK